MNNLELLSKLIYLKGKPFVPYLPFEQLYRSDQPASVLFKTGRQVSKTTSVLIQHIIQAATIPNFTILYINPLESQALRTSSVVLKPILNESPLLKFIKLVRDQSLFYSFNNNSNIILSYVSDDAERVRGTPGDKVHLDEVQSIQYKFIPIIMEALSASKWGLSIFTGTPKTTNNTLHFLWASTNQSEWTIKCKACNHWNIPSKDEDLDKMIGEYRDDISYEYPATICAKCGKIIFPQEGKWISKYPERTNLIGYHIPQIILPLHYADKNKWSLLLSKRSGLYGMSADVFYQEVLGEASDISTRLVDLDSLLKAATLGPRTDIGAAKQLCSSFVMKVFGIDWGGGGEEGNFTTVSLVGCDSLGRIYVPWATQLYTPHDHIREAKEILSLANIFKPDLIAHDYTGSGSLRETILVNSGYPIERIFPCRYVGGTGGVACKYVSPTSWHPRSCYHIDPSRCLLIVCASIKLGVINFFSDDYKNEYDSGLLRHFLALIDESKYVRGIESYRIVCEPGYRDEFAQATMLGCISIWYKLNNWPKFSF